jgi:hypothetical protein
MSSIRQPHFGDGRHHFGNRFYDYGVGCPYYMPNYVLHDRPYNCVY